MAAFERLDNEITASQSGTGLGLPLAQMMIELHGGSLTLESEVGVGTSFKIIFHEGRGRPQTSQLAV